MDFMKFAVVQTNETIDDLPYKVIEPELTFVQPMMTFIMWTVMGAITIPSAIHDWIITRAATARC